MFPARRVRRLFPVQAANPCPPLPPVDGSPVRRVLPVDLTSERSSALLSEPPPWVFPQEPPGPPKFSTLLSTHTALFVDPGRPSGTSPKRSLCVGFWHVNTIAICLPLLRGCVKLQGVRSPLRSLWFPVYASAGSFGFTTLLSNCNTRYGWLVGPYPAGTLTLQEAPSFAWRTND